MNEISKRGKAIQLVLAAVCLVVGLVFLALLGRSLYYRGAKTFSDGQGCSITLTRSFTQDAEAESYTLYGNEVCVFTNHYTDSRVEEALGAVVTAKEFAEAYYPVYQDTETISMQEYGENGMLVYYLYRGDDFTDYCCDAVLKEDSGYCVVTFWCLESERDRFTEQFASWAETVRVNE